MDPGVGRWVSRETVLLGETRQPGMVGVASSKHTLPPSLRTQEGHDTAQASDCTQSIVTALFEPKHKQNSNCSVTSPKKKLIAQSFTFFSCSASASFCKVSSLFSYNEQREWNEGYNGESNRERTFVLQQRKQCWLSWLWWVHRPMTRGAAPSVLSHSETTAQHFIYINVLRDSTYEKGAKWGPKNVYFIAHSY